MKYWLKKENCTGCGACANICPKNALKMEDDTCGFKYPKINDEKCINCGLCKSVCPILNIKDTDTNYKSKVYACWSKDLENRFKSTSGGLFTEIARNIIDNNGYVIGAAYNKENMVEHTVAHNLTQLDNLRQSKYLQSDTKDIYIEARRLLNNNSLLAFVGSPCQIAALKSFLKKDYDNLLTIEFICRGMNSPKAYKSWLSEIEQNENKKVARIWFKYKENGWKSSPRRTRIDFSDKTYKVFEGNDNKYMCGYLGPNLYIRPSCGDCKFNGIKRQADITLADFWGIEESLDDDKGTSLVLVNSKKGDYYFNSIKKNIIVSERNIDEIRKGNVCFDTSVIINKKSEKFLNELNDNNFTELVDKYSKIPLIKRIIKKIKVIIKAVIR